MRYVGNASLSEQIQERILTTFQQTLSLAKEGNHQEALLGCDFVLRLDPLFEPARQLQTRLNRTEGPIEVDDLAEAVATEAATDSATPAAEPEVASNIEPGLETATQGDADLPSKLALLLEQRSFEELRSLAVANQDQIAADPSLQEIAQTGIERLEAQPYVDNFLESSQKAKDSGDLEKAQGHLVNARELDPTHPGVATLEADLAGAASATIEDTLEEQPVDDLLAGAVVDAAEATATNADWLDELESPAEPVLEAEPAAEQASEIESEPTLEPLEPELLMTGDSEPAAQLDSESEGRIDQLLGEGQEAFESGEYQTAIDAWSRIFLIDIDHAEASRRIELARKLKAEVERQIEEAFHEGIQLVEAGKKDEAKEAFKKVLEIHPGHMGAREYMDKMESGDLTPAASVDAGVEAIPDDLAPISDAETGEGEPGAANVFDEVELAPDLTPEPEPVAPDFAPPLGQEAAPTAQPPKRSFALIGTAVLVLVLAVAWFLYSKRQSIFPNSDTDQEQTVQQQIDPIERARELHEEGKTAMAINVLRRLPPTHAQYSEGQSLIEAWAIIDSSSQAVEAGPSEDDLIRRDALLEEARSAADQREHLMALAVLEKAEAISPLEGEDLDFQALMTDNLDVLAEEIELFDQGDWEYALPSLWRLHEADGSNRDVRRLMVDSYYNLGLRDLQRGDARDAAEKFQEALQLEPSDAELQRLSDFAAAYMQRPSDLLYRIFVKYHAFR